jgi:tryptophan 2-monooxygenase
MSFMPQRPQTAPLRAAQVSAAPSSYVDILYDHGAYLRNNSVIGNQRIDGRSVAIVGSGAAGLLAAYQLMQLGANVVIFEATNRAGGRLNTIYPIPGQAAAFEMGAMRVPPCEQLFGYYTNLFGVTAGGQFPDPGQVNTRIIYRNQAYDWAAHSPPPAIFSNVNIAWNALATELAKITPYLTNPTPESLQIAQTIWQKWVFNAQSALGPEQGYSGISFYQALVQAFVENYQQYGLSQPWSANDFELFGALGVGSGGFGPLYSINFAEIARLIINGLESNQQFYPAGMDMLVQGFLSSCPDPNRPNLSIGNCISFNSTVTSVKALDCSSEPVVLTVNGQDLQFESAILATTNRAMQVDMNLTDGSTFVLPQSTNSGLRQLHLMNSSKLFVLTKTRFWQGTNLPYNIQSDTLVRGLYCLDYYPGLPEGLGVVLISYTWGDDSTKLLAITDPNERLAILLRSIENSAGDFVAALTPQIMPEYTSMIDWQTVPHYYGAFKLNQAGQDVYNQQLYTQFLRGGPVYIAGDSIGWCGGWIESALQTGMNAACAVVQQFNGPQALFPNSPMTQNPAPYQYGPPLNP